MRDSAGPSPEPRAAAPWRRALRLGALSVLVFAAAIGGYLYWKHQALCPSTSDAYLNANVLRIAPQVSGAVARVPVGSHQVVSPGQLLLEIDPAPFKIALQDAEAELQLARQQARAAQAAVEAARAVVTQRQAALRDAQDHADRVLALVSKGALPVAKGARAASQEAQAALQEATADLKRAQEELAARANTTPASAPRRPPSPKPSSICRTRASRRPPRAFWARSRSAQAASSRPARTFSARRDRFVLGRCQLPGDRPRPDPSGPAGDDHCRHVP